MTQERVPACRGQASCSETRQTSQDSFDAPKWLVIATAGAAIFLSTLDSGIINIALPSLANQFQVDFKAIAWAVTLYTSTIGITISLFGRLADRFGLLRVLRLGFTVFALGSLACGCSISAVQLNGFRVLQGAGAAMMQATAAALITTMIAPDRRKAALGIFATVLGLGPVLGPTVGGLIISWAGWRPVFWINLPVCLFGLWGCAALTARASAAQSPTRHRWQLAAGRVDLSHSANAVDLARPKHDFCCRTGGVSAGGISVLFLGEQDG